MRIRALPITVAAIVVVVVQPAAAAPPGLEVTDGEQCSTTLRCVSLQRPETTPMLATPDALKRQTQAGYYAYPRPVGGIGTDVAYVVPFGQAAHVSQEISELPMVQGAEKDFARGTVVVFSPGAMMLIPVAPERRAGADPRTTAIPVNTSHNGGIAPKAADRYGCNDNSFCLYRCSRFEIDDPHCPKVVFGQTYSDGRWKRLGDFGFNDMQQSMRNRRDKDSLLAKDWPQNGSTRYCAESHSEDANFADNPIGEMSASSFANLLIDDRC